jgi:hypothetical protein
MANNKRIYKTVFDASGIERKVRVVDAREIVEAGGSYTKPEDAPPAKKEKAKGVDPVTVNK